MKDALNPGPVRPLEREQTESAPEDARPFWRRLLRGIRPSVSVGKNKKTGEMGGEIGFKTKAEF